MHTFLLIIAAVGLLALYFYLATLQGKGTKTEEDE